LKEDGKEKLELGPHVLNLVSRSRGAQPGAMTKGTVNSKVDITSQNTKSGSRCGIDPPSATTKKIDMPTVQKVGLLTHTRSWVAEQEEKHGKRISEKACLRRDHQVPN